METVRGKKAASYKKLSTLTSEQLTGEKSMAKTKKKKSKIFSSQNMRLMIGVIIIIMIIVLTQYTIIIDVIEAKSMNLNFFMTDVFHRPEEISEGVYKINKA